MRKLRDTRLILHRCFSFRLRLSSYRYRAIRVDIDRISASDISIELDTRLYFTIARCIFRLRRCTRARAESGGPHFKLTSIGYLKFFPVASTQNTPKANFTAYLKAQNGAYALPAPTSFRQSPDFKCSAALGF